MHFFFLEFKIKPFITIKTAAKELIISNVF